GFFNSVACAEDVPFITQEEMERETKGTFLGDYRIAQQKKACEIWMRGRIPEHFADPVQSDVPTLIISGELDPVTPPRFGDEIVKNLSHGRQVIFRGESHSGSSECMDGIMQQFVSAGKSEELDISCSAQPSNKLEFKTNL